MKTYKAVNAQIFRGTLSTADISDLGDECTVFINKSSLAQRCFRCLGNIFRELKKTDTVACAYCKCEYQLK